MITKCKVNGNLGKQGKYIAMCGYIAFGDKSRCCAPIEKVCEHKEDKHERKVVK